MPNVTFVHPDGNRRTLNAVAGLSIMQAAITEAVSGIAAECGGNLMCATCHVYVDPAWVGRTPPVSDDEDALLEGAAAERRTNSRLSCQIIATTDLDGLVVHLPDRQV